MLFDRSLVYPVENGVGAYVELVGVITAVADELSNCFPVTVKTNKGTFVGYWHHPTTSPPLGSNATIRIYDGGYLDDRIVGWSIPD